MPAVRPPGACSPLLPGGCRTDGIFSSLIRTGATASDASKKWYMFDGPVDAIWIESMNTVLDDNKKLCLSSGEIIKLTEVLPLAPPPLLGWGLGATVASWVAAPHPPSESRLPEPLPTPHLPAPGPWQRPVWLLSTVLSADPLSGML